MLEVKNLQVNYGAVAALHGISLSVKQGAIVTLIGGNGAGKTTTLRAISGLQRAAAGAVVFDGRNITALPAHDIVKLGTLDPETIVTPGIFVKRIVQIDRVATQAGGFKKAA